MEVEGADFAGKEVVVVFPVTYYFYAYAVG